MPVCSVCTQQVDEYSMGVVIKPVYFERSQKSGRLVAQCDHFPDGATQRFLCSNCLPAIADIIGLFEQGFDFPREVASPLGAGIILEE